MAATPSPSISGGLSSATNPTSPCASGTKYKCCVVIVTNERASTPCSFVPSRTYPNHLDSPEYKNYYFTPLYHMHVYRAQNHKDPSTYCGKQTFTVVRFVVANLGQTYNSVKGVQNTPRVKGTPEEFILSSMCIYGPRSANGNQVAVAVQVHNNFLIHEGPMGCWDNRFGSNGCIELVGSWEHDRFLKVMSEYTEATIHSPSGKRDPLRANLPIYVQYKHEPRPVIGGLITQLTQDQYDAFEAEAPANWAANGLANPNRWFPEHVYDYKSF